MALTGAIMSITPWLLNLFSYIKENTQALFTVACTIGDGHRREIFPNFSKPRRKMKPVAHLPP